MRWSGQFTFVVIFPDKLIPICMVNAMLTDVLARGGMKVHRFVPSHRTGCVEMVVNSSTNSLGNGRPSLNRFVLDKCHLRMNYDMWFSTFSGSLHSAWGFRRVSTTVEDVFVQNNVCWKLVFGELRNLMWRWWRWFLPFAWQFGMSFIVFACACSTTNSKPFSTWFYFNNFVDENFVEMVLCFSLHAACEQLETVFWVVHDVFPTTFARPTFSFETGMIFLLKFDAPARCTSTNKRERQQHGTAADR